MDYTFLLENTFLIVVNVPHILKSRLVATKYYRIIKMGKLVNRDITGSCFEVWGYQVRSEIAPPSIGNIFSLLSFLSVILVLFVAS